MSRYWAAPSGECITHIRVDTTLLTEWLHPGIYTPAAQTQTHSQTCGEKTKKTWPMDYILLHGQSMTDFNYI